MARRSLIRVVGFNRVHMYTRARRPVLLKAWVMLGPKSLQSHSNPSDKRHRGVWRKKVTEEEILSWTPDPITCPLSGSARRSSCFSSSFFSSSPPFHPPIAHQELVAALPSVPFGATSSSKGSSSFAAAEASDASMLTLAWLSTDDKSAQKRQVPQGHLNWPRSLHIPHKSAQVSNGCPLFF